MIWGNGIDFLLFSQKNKNIIIIFKNESVLCTKLKVYPKQISLKAINTKKFEERGAERISKVGGELNM